MTDARMLESYAAGSWFRSDAEGDPLLDATTGEPVARVSLDIAPLPDERPVEEDFL